MRILQVLPTTDPEQGGVAEGVVRISAGLVQLGCDVELVTTDPPGSVFANDAGLIIHKLGSATAKYNFSPALVPWLRRNVDRYDIVVANSLWNYTSAATWLALGNRVPFVIYPHGMLDPWFGKAAPIKNVFKQGYWTLIEGRVLAAAKAVLFTAEEERALARTAFVGHSYRERVVSFGAVPPPRIGPDDVDAFRASVPRLGQRPYVLFMSRIHPKKGCDLLIKAFARLAGSYEGLDLVIAGPGKEELKAELRMLAHELGIDQRVHWVGMLSGIKKWAALSGALCFALPSHQENFGIVVAESMACGTPVLTTKKVNIWQEVLASGGGLVSTDDVDGTASILSQFLQLNSDQIDLMGERARAGFEQYFTVPKAAGNLLAVLREFGTPIDGG